jgi:hypothetical protein
MAQAAPHHHHLHPIVDVLRDADRGQQRQQSPDHDHARNQGGHIERQDDADFLPAGSSHDLRHQHRGQQEDERIGPEAELAPGTFHLIVCAR